MHLDQPANKAGRCRLGHDCQAEDCPHYVDIVGESLRVQLTWLLSACQSAVDLRGQGRWAELAEVFGGIAREAAEFERKAQWLAKHGMANSRPRSKVYSYEDVKAVLCFGCRNGLPDVWRDGAIIHHANQQEIPCTAAVWRRARGRET